MTLYLQNLSILCVFSAVPGSSEDTKTKSDPQAFANDILSVYHLFKT